MPLPKLTIVLGGTASGKSVFAEQLVTKTELSRVYVATAQAWDNEMVNKIATHRAQRGAGWRTVEEPRDLPRVLSTVTLDEVVLIDCATLWLTNLTLDNADPSGPTDALLTAIASCPAPVVIVSNELGMGIVPETPLGRQFRNAQGMLNQRIATAADLAVMVIAGLPLVLKGTLP